MVQSNIVMRLDDIRRRRIYDDGSMDPILKQFVLNH